MASTRDDSAAAAIGETDLSGDRTGAYGGVGRDSPGEAPPASPGAAKLAELTDAQLVELERMERDDAWAAPWRARTFEIYCPCPNGDDCGDTHSCAEVEAPEAYPDSPEAPATVGYGQCVVQISVPGLESLAGPNSEFIAAMRNALPALLAEVRRARAERGGL